MTWLSTTTGRIVDLLRPDPAAIDFRGDVAPQLARVARFGGAVGSGAYSVAQHCVVGADALYHETRDPTLAAAFLLHDAHEYLIGDIITPVVEALSVHLTVDNGREVAVRVPEVRMQLSRLKSRLDQAIHHAAGLPWPLPRHTAAAVKAMDLRVLRTERDQLTVPCGRRWASEVEAAKPVPMRGRLTVWPWPRAADEWLMRLDRYCPQALNRAA